MLHGHIYVSSGLKGEVRFELEIDTNAVELTPQGCCIYEDSWQHLVEEFNEKIRGYVTSYSFTGITVQNKIVARLHREDEHLTAIKH